MTDDRPMYWGPAGPPKDAQLVDGWTPGRSDEWGPYFSALFPPRKVTPFLNWKRMTTFVNIAQRLWNERNEKRRGYASRHGEDSKQWPDLHPGVVLETVESMAYPVCLGCQWLDRDGISMRDDGWRARALERAARHQRSDA